MNHFYSAHSPASLQHSIDPHSCARLTTPSEGAAQRTEKHNVTRIPRRDGSLQRISSCNFDNEARLPGNAMKRIEIPLCLARSTQIIIH
eukprot:3178653-Amphidinium_carterae.1